jgi:hypothetical protein
MKFSYGPIVRRVRYRHIRNQFDKEPAWRTRGAALTSGYQKRW